MEWKVDTHIAAARRPTSASTRSFISAAALLVKVIAMISPGCTWRSASSQPMRWVSTRVLPEPAPATISSGVPACTTASRWRGLRPSSSVRAAGGAGLHGRRRAGEFEQRAHRVETVRPFPDSPCVWHTAAVRMSRRFFYGYRTPVPVAA